MKQALFNPFLRIAGLRALLLGLLAMVVTAVVAFYSRAHFDGVLDIHVGKDAAAWVYFAEGLINWIITVILFFIAGLIFSTSKIRLIDVAGTMALARWPMIFAACIAFAQSDMPINPADIKPSLIVMVFAMLVFSIWEIVLMYNAYSVSCNVRGTKATVSFIGVLLIAEVISKLVFFQLYTHIHLF